MENTKASENNRKRTTHRSLTERIVVSGYLTLLSPAHFGNGDSDFLTDLPLIMDEVDGSALITGASIAGALRNYLREFELGYEVIDPMKDNQSKDYTASQWFERDLLATCLFGSHKNDIEANQSPLIVDDASSEDVVKSIAQLRDGVKLCPKTRTALDKHKYDYQLLPTGTQFYLRFELLLDKKNEFDKKRRINLNDKRKLAFALALAGLEKGEIHLGARKKRGFGRCKVSEWKVESYNLNQPSGLISWLALNNPNWNIPAQSCNTGSNIAELLKVNFLQEKDERQNFKIEARFKLSSSILVRSALGKGYVEPDAVHIQTKDKDGKESYPILPGTSLAGALRQRAFRIVKTLAIQNYLAEDNAKNFINSMFGTEGDEKRSIKANKEEAEKVSAKSSRVIVSESAIEGGQTLVQSRIKIDRFTGGTIETALFEEAPHFGGETTINISLRSPKDPQTEAEIGLLLLLLKDLWLEDLPVGGAINVGRGRLQGICAEIHLSKNDIVKMKSNGKNGEVTFLGNWQQLQSYIDELNKLDWMRGNK